VKAGMAAKRHLREGQQNKHNNISPFHNKKVLSFRQQNTTP